MKRKLTVIALALITLIAFASCDPAVAANSLPEDDVTVPTYTPDTDSPKDPVVITPSRPSHTDDSSTEPAIETPADDEKEPVIETPDTSKDDDDSTPITEEPVTEEPVIEGEEDDEDITVITPSTPAEGIGSNPDAEPSTDEGTSTGPDVWTDDDSTTHIRPTTPPQGI